MKTLDEVIDTFEKACDLERRCEGCSGCLSHDYGCPNSGAESVPIALHYLKEYRDAKNALDAERGKTIEAYRQWQDAKEKLEAQTSHKMWVDKHFQFEISDNPPLTWDELKAMKGKPVWVVEEGYQTWEYWSLVYWMKDDELTLLNENGQTTYSKNEQGTVWQAYRKERQNVQS